ncbi:hypothetical protein AAC387_Pa05g2336 [Persea americana]
MRLVMMMGVLATTVLLFQSFMLPYRSSSLSPFPAGKISRLVKWPLRIEESFSTSTTVGELPPLNNSTSSSALLGLTIKTKGLHVGVESEHNIGSKENNNVQIEKVRDPDDESSMKKDRDSDDGSSVEKIQDPDKRFTLEKPAGMDDDYTLEMVRDPENGLFDGKAAKAGNDLEIENTQKSGDDISAVEQGRSSDFKVKSPPASLSYVLSVRNSTVVAKLDVNAAALSISVASNTSSTGKEATRMFSGSESSGKMHSATLNEDATFPIIKMKQGMASSALSKMNHLLQRTYVSSRSMKRRFSNARERELLFAKKQIEYAPTVRNDLDLYTPVFRNISRFKRSYELMERLLKVYVYREGEKPIFHKPLLKGIYANEGWFMKLMEGNKRYVVRDPRKAHLFYLPFSSRLLQIALYVPRSHNLKNLEEYLKNYADKIAAKYPFWNRTGGEDHFLVACHDWAPHETRHMARSIRALCNADLSRGFKLGKDVSLPETYVRSAQNPLRDVGGNPASQRPTLAFYAGNMHGNLRPILLKYWDNKDPDMKIIGPMPPGVESKMTYIQHMKSSKYCICPRGYEVNSPRVVEAIFYECVPVIISDNYVPPFFEILNWEAFSVFVAEKDIPMLKDILASIPEEKYQSMQLGVKRVQQHFLWHQNPKKYDLFHMTLHSIWFNRLHQVRIR